MLFTYLRKTLEASREGLAGHDRDTVKTCLVSLLLQPVQLKPLHVLQCHSKKDSAEDFSTQLWACAFQPLYCSTGMA